MAVLALGGIAAAARDRLDGDASSRPASRWPSLAFVADRPRRRRRRHLAPGAARQARRRQRRRAAAATIVWLMMIAGIAITAAVAGRLLDPFSPARLVAVTAVVVAVPPSLLTLLAVWGVERRRGCTPPADAGRQPPFREALRAGLGRARGAALHHLRLRLDARLQRPGPDPRAVRRPRLRPHARRVDQALRPAARRRARRHDLRGAGRQLSAAAASARCAPGPSAAASPRRRRSAAWSPPGVVGPGWPLQASVFALGVANGAFAVAAIGSMMALAGRGREAREGVRMGLWGAAQAIAFGLGGFAGTVAADLARQLYELPGRRLRHRVRGRGRPVPGRGRARRPGRAARRRREPATTAGAPCPAGLGGR